jgi:pimeloyl-ACP methyl ester carboxylesterase
MVDAGGRCLHVHEAGSGAPVVVLEAGLGATGLSWRPVQERIARFARVISYDRAGLGWSDLSPAPLSLQTFTKDLRAVLNAIDARPPYVLVGHSFGSAIVTAYSRAFASEVRGLVLVDPLRPAEWFPLPEDRRRMLARGASLSRRGATLARIGVAGFCLRSLLAGSRRLPRAISKAAASTDGTALMGRLAGEVAKLPRELWPVVAAHWSQPKCYLALAQHLDALPGVAAELAAGPPADVPVITLAPEPGGGHWIQLDQPERVAAAVRQLSA